MATGWCHCAEWRFWFYFATVCIHFYFFSNVLASWTFLQKTLNSSNNHGVPAIPAKFREIFDSTQPVFMKVARNQPMESFFAASRLPAGTRAAPLAFARKNGQRKVEEKEKPPRRSRRPIATRKSLAFTTERHTRNRSWGSLGGAQRT